MKNKLMKEVGDKVETFKQDNQKVAEMSTELQQRTNNIKVLIDRYDQISTQLEKVEEEYDRRSKELFNTDKLKHIKTAISSIKKELHGLNIQEGLYRGHLTNAQLKEGGDALAMYSQFDNYDSPEDDYKDDNFEL